MDPGRECKVLCTIVMKCALWAQNSWCNPIPPRRWGRCDMEDVVRFVNVDLVEFHALRHKHKPQAHGVHGFDREGGGGDAVARIGQKCGKMRKNCGKCGKKMQSKMRFC